MNNTPWQTWTGRTPIIYEAGHRFGDWCVVSETERNQYGIVWLIAHSCGAQKKVPGTRLRTGRPMRCSECTKKDNRPPLRNIWRGMVARCHKPTDQSFGRYGAKGITVCERWRESFEAFAADMGTRPTTQHTVDRIDGTKGYEPGNCRWATIHEQANNKRSNRTLTHAGETLTLAQWAQRVGMPQHTLKHRLDHGWPAEAALTRRPRWLLDGVATDLAAVLQDPGLAEEHRAPMQKRVGAALAAYDALRAALDEVYAYRGAVRAGAVSGGT